MKKRIMAILLGFIFLLSLTSCNLNKKEIVDDKKEEKPETEEDILPFLSGKTVKGNSFTYDITMESFNEFKKEMDKALEYVEAETNYEYFKDVYDRAEDDYYELIDASEIEYLEYSVSGDSSCLDKSEEFSSAKVDLLEWFNKVEHLAFNNSFKERIWPDKTDEEILEEIGSSMPSEYYELTKKRTELENDYQLLEYGSNTYLDDVDKIFVEYVDVTNKISKYLGYENNLEYSYPEEYRRDYGYEDTDNFFKYVIEYLIPYYYEAYKNYVDSYKIINNQQLNEYKDFLYGDCFNEDKFKNITNYKKYMGGILEESYDNLFKKDGYYFISYEKDGFDGAFQQTIKGTPLVFYGPGYHDMLTVVHEFGHYTYDLKGGKCFCYDLCETHSQANELLFLDYYVNNNSLDENYKKLLINYKLKDTISSIILFSLVNEIEKICYTKEDLKIGDLKKELEKIYQDNETLKNVYTLKNAYSYIADVTMDSPCYYISYATSLIGSLDIYKMATKDFNKAKESYYKLFIYDCENNYRDIYNYAGLHDPLSEDVFKYITM